MCQHGTATLHDGPKRGHMVPEINPNGSKACAKDLQMSQGRPMGTKTEKSKSRR